ncbi:MAG: glycoside hydrolase 5 family protein [Deltaproteobacteria bacterium]
MTRLRLALLLPALCLIGCAGVAPPAWPADAGAPVAAQLCLSGFLGAPDGGLLQAVLEARAAHFRAFRFDLTWSAIERTRGVYDFARYDEAVGALADAGFHPLAIVDYDNPLYEGPDGGPLDGGIDGLAPTDPAPIAAFAAAAAGHFGAAIDYEIWNEPNNAFRFWQSAAPPNDPDPAGYARLLSLAATSVHAACPRCRVLGGSLDFHGQERADDFLAGMLAAEPGFPAQIDALSFHAYPTYPPTASPDYASPGGGPDPDVPLPEMAAELRSELAAAGGPAAMPLAMTEVGWPTGAGWVTPETQASDLVRALVLSFSVSAAPVCLYTLADGPNAQDPEDNFGIYDSDGGPKPAVSALASLQTALGLAAYEADRRGELGLTPGEQAFSFLSSSGRTTVLWSDDAPRTLAVPAHAQVASAALVLLDGGSSAIAPADGGYAVALAVAPVILVERR